MQCVRELALQVELRLGVESQSRQTSVETTGSDSPTTAKRSAIGLSHVTSHGR